MKDKSSICGKKALSSKQLSAVERRSDTITTVCDNIVFHLSYLGDVIMNVVVEQKAFAEFKVNKV